MQVVIEITQAQATCNFPGRVVNVNGFCRKLRGCGNFFFVFGFLNLCIAHGHIGTCTCMIA